MTLLAMLCFAGNVTAEETVVGTYAMTIQPTTMAGEKTQATATIKVEVKNDGDNYWVVEAGETNYFKGQKAPFTYNAETKLATFAQTCVGSTTDAAFAETPHLWSAAFVYNAAGFTEPQPEYAATFDTETGFVFGEDGGLAWYGSDSETTFNPASVYAAFYVLSDVKKGDTSIEGSWDFTLNGHYQGAESLGQIKEAFKATVNGSTVTFASTGSPYNIVGELTSPTTITFGKALVGSAASVNVLWQVPYVNANGANELEALAEGEAITATYDAAAGTITFPANSGLKYGYFNNETNVLNYWADAFDFVSAAKAAEYTVIGTYTMNIRPTTTTGDKSQPVAEIEVEVRNSGDNYWMVEVSKTNYFKGQTIPFTYNAETKFATFTAFYAGEFNENYTWFSAFVYDGFTTELQPTYGVTFKPTTGFEFPANAGLGWFVTTSAEDFDAQEVYTAFYVLPAGEGNATIEGEWNFTLNGHYQGSYSLGQFNDTFNATQNGNTITFTSAGGKYNIVGTVTSPTTITLSKTLVGSAETVYGLWQVPYVNAAGTDNIDELTEEESIIIDYDAATGTITFPANSGLKYGYFNNTTGELSYWEDAYDFVSATKVADYAVVGTYTMNIQPTTTEGEKVQSVVEITVEVRNSNNNYTMVEVSNTNYFKSEVIPFTYNSNTELAQFTAAYAGNFADNAVWFSAFIFNGSVAEPQENYGVTFKPETGFEFPKDAGLGWFVTTSAEDFDAQEVYSAFYVLPVGGGNEEVADVRTWDFTKWSEETVANLKADAAQGTDTGWSDDEKNDGTNMDATAGNCFWAITTPNENGELLANGVVIEELKGLVFGANVSNRGMAIAVNYPSTSLGTYHGPAYLWLGGANKQFFTIPAVAGGATIKMGIESHKNTDARGVNLLVNGESIGEFKPTTYEEYTWTVPAGEAVDVVVDNTNGCHIYFITVTAEGAADAITTTTVKTQREDGAIYNLQGQKVEKAVKGLYIINGKKVIIK